MNTHSPFSKDALVFTCMQYKSFENTVGKGEIVVGKPFHFGRVQNVSFGNKLKEHDIHYYGFLLRDVFSKIRLQKRANLLCPIR